MTEPNNSWLNPCSQNCLCNETGVCMKTKKLPSFLVWPFSGETEIEFHSILLKTLEKPHITLKDEDRLIKMSSQPKAPKNCIIEI